MPYVTRGPDGRIDALHRDAPSPGAELLGTDHPR
jgi:hypothetical protein